MIRILCVGGGWKSNHTVNFLERRSHGFNPEMTRRANNLEVVLTSPFIRRTVRPRTLSKTDVRTGFSPVTRHSTLILSFTDNLHYTSTDKNLKVLFLFVGLFVPHQVTLLLTNANTMSTASAFGCGVLSSMTQTGVMWCHRWAADITSVSFSVIIRLNSCGAGLGDGHNKPACVQGQQFSNNIPQILHATGGTFASKGLRRNWVGGDWYFLNGTGKAKQSLTASPHQLVASSPGHMPNPPAYTHWTDIVSWLMKTFGH